MRARNGCALSGGLSVPSAVRVIGAVLAPKTPRLAYVSPGALVNLGRGDMTGQERGPAGA